MELAMPLNNARTTTPGPGTLPPQLAAQLARCASRLLDTAYPEYLKKSKHGRKPRPARIPKAEKEKAVATAKGILRMLQRYARPVTNTSQPTSRPNPQRLRHRLNPPRLTIRLRGWNAIHFQPVNWGPRQDRGTTPTSAERMDTPPVSPHSGKSPDSLILIYFQDGFQAYFRRGDLERISRKPESLEADELDAREHDIDTGGLLREWLENDHYLNPDDISVEEEFALYRFSRDFNLNLLRRNMALNWILRRDDREVVRVWKRDQIQASKDLGLLMENIEAELALNGLNAFCEDDQVKTLVKRWKEADYDFGMHLGHAAFQEIRRGKARPKTALVYSEARDPTNESRVG